MKPTIFICTIMMSVGLSFPSRSHFNVSHHSTIDSSRLKIIYLGTAGWEITDGKTVILVDPYLSRLRRNYSLNPDSISPSPVPGDTRKAYGDNDFIEFDTATIDRHIKTADYILVHHAHRDHIMDVPYIALKTGATVIGHESTANIMRAYGVAEEKIITVKGGEDYEFGTFSVKVMQGLHSPLDEKRYYDSRIISKDLKAPLKVKDYVEGGSLVFLIRFKGHQIITFGSMNYIEKELEGLHPDIAIVGANASRNEIYDYAGRLMRVLNYPAVVIPTHWDNWSVPYDAPQDEQLKQLESFKKEIKKASPKTKIIVPKYFEPIVFPAPQRSIK
jgi:L-ascorbate metabolism protein UlaG (beta-lactamase superfamily)